MTVRRALHRACLTTTAIATATALMVTAGPSSAGSAAPDLQPLAMAQAAFSPNGDGVKDRLKVQYRLERSSPVTITVRRRGSGKALLVTRLPRRSAGDHTWSWDGRTTNGRTARHGDYTILLATKHGRTRARTSVDLRFEAGIAPLYGDPDRPRARVYPRSVVVRDALPLRATSDDGYVRRAFLRITDRAGDVVHRRKLTRRDFRNGVAWEARAKDGHPLPAGRYRAVVKGVDHHGNRGVGKSLRIWVSQDQLAWRETSRIVTAQDSHYVTKYDPPHGPLDTYESFHLLCGTVEDSARTAGALTHRAGACGNTAPPMKLWAESMHHVDVPEAERGVGAFRVAFAGSPTTPGEADLGHLLSNGRGMAAYYGDRQDDVESASSAQTDWTDAGPFRHGASWSFWTEGDDAFDVATFTVDLRYLAPAD